MNNDQLRQEIEIIIKATAIAGQTLGVMNDDIKYRTDEAMRAIAKHDRELIEAVLEEIQVYTLNNSIMPMNGQGSLEMHVFLKAVDRIRARFLGEK